MDEQASFESQPVLSRRRTGWNRLLVGLPVFAFAAIAWAGLSGARPSADTADRAVDASPAPSRPGADLPMSIPAHDPGIAIPLWPDQVLGLHVRMLRGMNQLELVGGPEIAVGGWYEAGSRTACPQVDAVDLPGYAPGLGVVVDAQAFCERSGRLFASSPSESTDGTATYRLENRFKNDDLPALGVVMRRGIAVSSDLDQTAEAAPVVFIARLVWPFEGCARFVTRCRPNLLVDRVIWARGLGHTETTSILPSLLATAPRLLPHPRDVAARETLGATGPILMETFVDRRTLAVVDPDAAAIVARASPNAQRIWYRRMLGWHPAGDAPRWIAMDDATGDVIASGIVGVQPGPRLPADGVNVVN
jgi:hypothetical protein